MTTYIVPGTPIPKPRQTRRDVWMKRMCVIQYRDYADRIRAHCKGKCSGEIRILFYMPIPATYSKKQHSELPGTEHQVKPDCDNMIKGVIDALTDNDSHVYYIEAAKYWADSKGARTEITL
jgi:Holliday junction resolvase RusA-like endonuclease